VHGHILPFDYFTHQTDRPHGLARIATVVRQARGEAGPGNCLLVDSGDFLQGTPLSDLTPHPGHGWRGQHPVLRAMNTLGYDAATLGNHEFNFGLDWLRGVLCKADFPVICANAVTCRGDTPLNDVTLLPPFEILTREVHDAQGTPHRVRIGLIGLTPPQIMTWDHAHLSGRLTARDMVDCARAWVPLIRSKGADLVIALAHTGLEATEDRGRQAPHLRPDDAIQIQPMLENAARAIAGVPGIDAVIAGHSHRRYPACDDDATAPTGAPCVIPGFAGSHLGQLDLDLARHATGWHVTGHRTTLRPVADAAPCDRLMRRLARAHAHTVRLTDRVVARTAQPIHSYLSMVQDDLATQIVNDVQRAALQEALENTPHAGLPVLSATAPFKTGGRGGPGIRDLCHGGRPVSDMDRFVIATNSYRAWGGGPFRPLASGGMIYRGRLSIREMIVEHVLTLGTIQPQTRADWGFVPMPGTHAELETGPGLRTHSEEIAALGASDVGTTETGFLRLRIPIEPRARYRAPIHFSK